VTFRLEGAHEACVDGVDPLLGRELLEPEPVVFGLGLRERNGRDGPLPPAAIVGSAAADHATKLPFLAERRKGPGAFRQRDARQMLDEGNTHVGAEMGVEEALLARL
jgi:hypothetical protein